MIFGKPKPQVQIEISDKGLKITTVRNKSDGRQTFALSEAGTSAVTALVPILVERELAISSDEEVLVANENISYLYSEDLGLSDYLPNYCPYVLQIKSRGNIGDSSLTFEYGFFSGVQEIGCSLIGTFIKRASEFFFLPPSMFQLLTALERFNNLDAPEKDKTNAFLALAEIKAQSKICGANLDRFISNENVVIAEKVGFDLIEHDDDSLSILPTVNEAPSVQLQKRFNQLREVESVYDLDTQDGGRIRVIFPPPVRDLVKRMKSASGSRGSRKREILANPLSVFEGAETANCLDLSSFSPRVRGIGDPVFQPKPYVKRKTMSFLDAEGIEQVGSPRAVFGIEAQNAFGETIQFDFDAPETFNNFVDKAQYAVAMGDSSLTWEDNRGIKQQVPLSDEFLDSLESVRQTESQTVSIEPSSGEPPMAAEPDQNTPAQTQPSERKYLLIYENEEAVDYVEGSSTQGTSCMEFESPSSLATQLNGAAFELKDYQKEGIAWLQTLVRTQSIHSGTGRRGVLLADDMGLGKTLQMLTFLAWCIERGLANELGSANGPYRPALVVAPVILLQIWKGEIEKFFEGGTVFSPYHILHGTSIKDLKKVHGGKEYEVGDACLDLDFIRRHRLIITNYDTVKNYQHSFARIPWSFVICDEAQEIKEPKTAVTWALKSQNSIFRIAMTGTPVENRLLDLWNICDFFQPGLLGSAKEFSDRFENTPDDASVEHRQTLASELRERLHYNRPTAFILRRQKIDKLDGLPKKHEHIRRCQLTHQQKQLHAEIVGGLKATKGKAGQHLKAIQRLARLYQHPSLDIDKGIDKKPDYYLDHCPKLQDTIQLLHEIRSRREKVLIFALFTKMQLILKKVIDAEFDLSVDIVNGSVSAAGAGTGKSLRHKIIDCFESAPGFNVLILSPDVAGVGLTITAANNVIHYGRWWNPAKEAQATDRVYRLGQTRDVNVYYPIATCDEFCTFDEKLHSLLINKRELASDFLVPTGSLDITESELMTGLDAVSSQTGNESVVEFKTLKNLSRDRLVSSIAAAFKAKEHNVTLAPREVSHGFAFAYRDNDGVVLALVAQKSAEVRSLLDLGARNRIVIDPQMKMRLVCIGALEGFDRESKQMAGSLNISLLDQKAVQTLMGKGVRYQVIFGLEDERPSNWDEAVDMLSATSLVEQASK